MFKKQNIFLTFFIIFICWWHLLPNFTQLFKWFRQFHPFLCFA